MPILYHFLRLFVIMRCCPKNIRYYKGSTEVNQGIKDVLKTQPDKFFTTITVLKFCARKSLKGLHTVQGVKLDYLL